MVVEPIEEVVWREKYKHETDETVQDTYRRVAEAVFEKDPKRDQFIPLGIDLLSKDFFVPGGRIMAGAGTNRDVTLINCYVSETIEDSLRGIMHALSAAAFTMQMGGGIGMDFSSLRPRGAIVKRSGSITSGVIPFMDMWNAMCKTIKSGGTRRGAMMATLRCDHPDVIEFIKAKHKKGVLTNFNVSVLVTDRFMNAVRNDEYWVLSSPVQPATGAPVLVPGNRYGYTELKARELWDMILRSTYEYSEPGVIFIDRINKTNNLRYCESIQCTNPCSEQPLPPHGACNLGAVNLAKMVDSPFTTAASIMWDQLIETVKFGVRFLDNVLDVTRYPLEEQQCEAQRKRRTGLGIMGLGNALQMLQIRYGSERSLQVAAQVMKTIRDTAYRTSIELARIRGPFPAFVDRYLESSFVKNLPEDIQSLIKRYGIRNGLILTIAPTGNTSVWKGNISGSGEPSYDWKFIRTMLRADDSLTDFECEDYGYQLFKKVTGHTDGQPLPSYMVTAKEIPVQDHITMQSVLQAFVDASISKTINCPANITFEDFRRVYDLAYDMGVKGVTTYRESEVRGAVLSSIKHQVCPSCDKRTLIKIDGCSTCTECGYGVCNA